MRTSTFLGAALLLAFVADHAAAQQPVRVESSPRGWLGFSYDTLRRQPGARPVLVIREVHDDSPAERAGLQPGDTLIRIGELNASPEIMASIGSALTPGEDVRLRVRREGREREVTVTVAERPAGLAALEPGRRIVVIDRDSLRDRLHILIDSARKRIDGLDIPSVYIERFDDPNLPPNVRLRMVRPDSTFVLRMDSLATIYSFLGDSMRMRVDTVWQRMLPRMQAFSFRDDSLFRFYADSAGHAFSRRFMFSPDSLGPGGTYHLQMLPGTAMFGIRAIAGAELAELTPGLSEYFGVERGVLVMRVPSGTPAERAGLQAGDVIVSAGGTDVANVTELRSAVVRAGPNQPVRLEIIRKRNRVSLELQRE